MTDNNYMNNAYRKAADDLSPNPNTNSWDRLEQMLDNDRLSRENKSYKRRLFWLSSIAASLLVVFAVTNFSQDQSSSEKNIAYNIENMIEASGNPLYDIDRLSKLSKTYN